MYYVRTENEERFFTFHAEKIGLTFKIITTQLHGEACLTVLIT